MLAQRQEMVRAAAVAVSCGDCHGCHAIRPEVACLADRGQARGCPLFPAAPPLLAALLCCRWPRLVLALAGTTRQARRRLPDTAEIAVLPSPIAPWKGAPLRVIVAAEKPLNGELSLIAPDGSVAAKSRERHGGPPYFWFAEVASPAAGTMAGDARARGRASRLQHDHARHRRARRQAAAAAARRRAASGRCAIPGIARRKICYSAWIEKLFDAPLDAELSWPALHEVLRDRSRNFLFNHLGLGEDADEDRHAPRLRRPAVFLARLFRVQDGVAVRLFEVLARRRRQGADAARSGSTSRRCRAEHPEGAVAAAAPPNRVPALLEQPASARLHRPPSAAGDRAPSGSRASFGNYSRTRRRRRAFRLGPHRAQRQQHRLLSGAAQAGDAAAGHRLRRSVRPHSGAGAARAADGRRGGRHFSRSTGSPTARSRASASGAAISCSRRTPRSAARASSASGRSCATRTARCGG